MSKHSTMDSRFLQIAPTHSLPQTPVPINVPGSTGVTQSVQWYHGSRPRRYVTRRATAAEAGETRRFVIDTISRSAGDDVAERQQQTEGPAHTAGLSVMSSWLQCRSVDSDSNEPAIGARALLTAVGVSEDPSA